MRKELTPAEVQARFDQINKRSVEQPSEQELASFAEAQAMDDGSAVSLEQFREELEDYSGKLVLRIPKSLHKTLRQQAAVEGVSLNQYLLYKLAQ